MIRIALAALSLAAAATLATTTTAYEDGSMTVGTVSVCLPGAPCADDASSNVAPAWLTDAPVPACANEDGSESPLPCYWDGATMGNGTGAHIVHGPDGTVWDVDAATLR